MPAGFDTPEWAFNGLFGGVGSHAEFILFQQECFSDTSPSLTRGTEALVTQVSSGPAACRITFINRSEGPPEVTTTPPPEVCAVCNRTTTPPPATSTPAPPTNTPAPSTPVPPTATTSTGTQAPGLTDEQRTATAVAGAKTAAAQVTPIAPKTGAGGAGGSAQGTNLALIVIAMAMVGGGLSLIASRRRL